MTVLTLVDDVAALDTDWYLWFVRLAQDTPWLQPAVLLYTNAGLVLFAVLVVVAWRWARHQPAEALVSVLWVPVVVLLAYGISNLVKVTFREPRPCHAIQGVLTVAPCDFATDYSFPSNHAVIAATAAFALLVAHRRIGALALGLAVLMGLSRVYIGAHYPHDVVAGFLLGGVVAVAGIALRPGLTSAVERLRTGRGSWLAGPPTQLTRMRIDDPADRARPAGPFHHPATTPPTWLVDSLKASTAAAKIV